MSMLDGNWVTDVILKGHRGWVGGSRFRAMIQLRESVLLPHAEARVTIVLPAWPGLAP
jgi:hypothetical protein